MKETGTEFEDLTDLSVDSVAVIYTAIIKPP
jgi:hypothetical protein